MSDYNIFPAVNRDLEFPQGIRARLAQADELKQTYAHLEDGKLVIAGRVVAAAAGSGSTVGGTTYGKATATEGGIVTLAVDKDVTDGTSGSVVVNSAMLKRYLATKATVSGSIKGLWGGTQAELDQIAQREPNTIYFVVSSGS